LQAKQLPAMSLCSKLNYPCARGYEKSLVGLPRAYSVL
jgi:hypothetical protein